MGSGGGEFREGRGDVLAARIEQAQAPMPVPGGVRPEFPRARDDLVHDLDDGERRQLLDELLGDAQPRVVEVEQDGFGECCQGQLSECATFPTVLNQHASMETLGDADFEVRESFPVEQYRCRADEIQPKSLPTGVGACRTTLLR